jgi:hypothetical protein
MIFDPNISSLEERTYLDTLSMDELHGILTTYEMRTRTGEPSHKGSNIQSIQEDKEKEKEKSKVRL